MYVSLSFALVEVEVRSGFQTPQDFKNLNKRIAKNSFLVGRCVLNPIGFVLYGLFMQSVVLVLVNTARSLFYRLAS